MGKTTLRERYIGRGFKTTYLMTVGADFALHKFTMEGTSIKLQIWDLAGQERFQSVRGPFFVGAAGVICVFDVTRQESLENMRNWVEESIKNIGGVVPVVFLANKVDLRDKESPLHISTEHGKRALDNLMKEFSIKTPYLYYETSAKTGENVQKGFEELAMLIMRDRLSQKK